MIKGRLKNWFFKRYLGHPTKTREEWIEWERQGYFMLMGKKFPYCFWFAVDVDGMIHPGSFRNERQYVEEWIGSREGFQIVAFEARPVT